MLHDPRPLEGASAAMEPVAPPRDYDLVRDAIAFISGHYREQPSLGDIAGALKVEERELETLFRRWCGLTPKAFLQAVTLDHARGLLKEGLPLLDAAMEVGLSGPSRLHDLFVKHEGVSPGIHKAKGAGLALSYGFADCRFARALVLWTEKGVAGLAFADPERGGEEGAFADMARRWPLAAYARDDRGALPHLARIFDQGAWEAAHPLRIVLIGTDFEVRVWQALLAIPVGAATTYSAIASGIGAPKASRAVGAAVGRNPISFVVPCHRVVGKSGALTGYHWGLTRKRAMLGWEAGVLART